MTRTKPYKIHTESTKKRETILSILPRKSKKQARVHTKTNWHVASPIPNEQWNIYEIIEATQHENIGLQKDPNLMI